MKRILLGIALCLSISTYTNADTVYFSGVLDSNSPTFDAPGASGLGSALQYYSQTLFTVDTTGAYTFESASVNSTGTPSDAIDTFLVLYANAFDPNSPGGQLTSNDDFTGSLTVLPGPYAGNGVTSTATGFAGAQPSSRVLDFNLNAGTDYYLINTSFRDTTYESPTTSNGGPTGTFYTGITGPGIITVVPEPGALALLGLTAMGLVLRRRRA